MKFGPADANEALVFAVEELKANTQYEILRALSRAGMTQADLARKLEVTPSWVSQALSDDANLTLDTIAKIFLGLGLQCHFSSQPVEPHFAQAVAPARAADALWTVHSGVELAPKPTPKETTTALLMKAIRSGCQNKREMTMVNDNGGRTADKQATAA